MKSKMVTVVLLSSVAFLVGGARVDRSLLGYVSMAGVQFSLGDGWTSDKRTAGHGLYPTRLVSRSGMVRVVLLPTELGDPKTAAAGLRTTFDADPAAVKGSFSEQPFVTESALWGIHVSFRKQVLHGGAEAESECHYYIVRNHCGRYVVVNYQAEPNADPVSVDHLIQSTLRLQ